VPTLRDLVVTLRRRDGVDAAVVLGHDGLVIDGDADASVDVERIAAHMPGVVAAANGFGTAAARGPLVTAVLEHADGLALVAVLSADALLVVVVRAEADVAALLYDLRRSRTQLAALV
jgi:predicted regulator of Ras-like GTPase activity (Roadblock/LC7/MglB family)